MKITKALAILAVLPVVATTALGQTATQRIDFAKGWNAFYLEVTPDDSKPADVFGDLPVTQVGCYLSSAFEPTAQYADDGSRIEGQPISYAVWVPESEVVSTLKSIVGGVVYLCYATNRATLDLEGVPALPQNMWRETTHGGMMNLAGVSMDGSASSTVANYFGEGPAGARPQAYLIGGQADRAPSFLPVQPSRAIRGGEAYALGAEKGGLWPGVLSVQAGLDGSLTFEPGGMTRILTIRNAGKERRTIRVSRQKSSRVTDLWHGLSIYDPQGRAAEWVPFEEPVERALDPGAEWRLRFSPDRTGLTDPSAVYASLLRVDSVGDDARMRVLVPVRVETPSPDDPAGEDAFPAGLWSGIATLSQVTVGTSGEPKAAGGRMPVRLLVHVGADGSASLLQRVAIAQEPVDERKLAFRPVLYEEMTSVPDGLSARRLSSLALDTANRSVPASANADETASVFGTKATFRFVVGEHSAENPFRHSWHPDHDGKTADYSGETPSGDVAKNFAGVVKPESFSVTNRVVLSWIGPDGKSNFRQDPMEGTYGQVDWYFGGLRADGEIHARGTFILKRIAPCATIR